MGRPRIVERRLKEILKGRVLRWSEIFDEYKKMTGGTEPYQQMHHGLRRLKEKGEVIEIDRYYCLTIDLLTGDLLPEILNKVKRRWTLYATSLLASDCWRLYKIVNTYTLRELQQYVRDLEESSEWSAFILANPTADTDKEHIRGVLRRCQEIKAIVNWLLRLGLFSFELEKARRLAGRLKEGWDELEKLTLESIERLKSKGDERERERALERIRDTIRSYDDWRRKQHTPEEVRMAKRYLEMLKRMEEALRGR